ncbi:MAG: DNA repair protein RadA [Candidatus Pacebacteria bacterium]|nr:DNA repair protein RadA [Candidatus Paceibacterota bacterium]
MSAKFVCQKCGASHPKWQGQCNDCGQWHSLVEEVAQSSKSNKNLTTRFKPKELEQFLVSLPEEDVFSSDKKRVSSLIGELDRVLGGGLVAGVVALIGGEPGIGKSTLLTQLVLKLTLAKKRFVSNKQPILYVCGEESPQQISLRIKRIAKNEHKKPKKTKQFSGQDLLEVIGQKLLLVTTTDVDQLLALIKQHQPSLLVVDSIQTLSTSDLTGASGSVGQIRECTQRLIEVVKPRGIATFLVGHVTKEGSIAGPKILEHMVDTVLEMEGERTGQLRLLRAVKNRFGATDEVGVFRLTDLGLTEVSNPSELFLDEVTQGVPGSATVCTMEGTRPLLAEIQALVVDSNLAMPRRVGRGIELSRIQVLAAVLQKHAKLPLGSKDVFLSATGGFKLKEPAIDLGCAVAVASSLKNKKLPKNTVFIGEIGLLGELRTVSFLKQRIKEAKRLGFKKIISRQSHKTIKQVLKELGC